MSSNTVPSAFHLLIYVQVTVCTMLITGLLRVKLNLQLSRKLPNNSLIKEFVHKAHINNQVSYKEKYGIKTVFLKSKLIEYLNLLSLRLVFIRHNIFIWEVRGETE